MDEKQVGVFHEWLRYEPDGKLYWRKKASSKAMPGYQAGWFDKDGYLVTTLKGKKFRLARVVWMMHNGPIPAELHIDHINRIKTDNRIENLRLATPSENACNKGMQSNNTTGVIGCTLVDGKYQAQIGKGAKYIYLGRYVNLDDAKAAYDKAAKFLHGEFANGR